MTRTFFVFISLVLCFVIACTTEHSTEHTHVRGKQEYPGEWMYGQRAFPFERINTPVYEAERARVAQHRNTSGRGDQASWTPVGPLNIGGRITDIVLHPKDAQTLYVGAANGGVFRTYDGGETWDHVFAGDGKLAIGDLAMAPSANEILYIGTGEANGSATSGAFFGDGVYRSDNAGDTWTWAGLKETHHIGRIIVHPDDPDHVLVAAMGHLYGKNDVRGVFRTTNGGADWDRVLFINDSTGVIDIARDPMHPDTIYAASWERLRFPHVRDYAGVGSGVYRSFDGGTSWERVTTGLPVHDQVGRIGLTVGVDGTVYAAFSEDEITNDFSGLYASSDAGSSWLRVDDISLQEDGIYSGFGWYFGNVRTDPHDASRVYILGLRSWESRDAGFSWNRHSPNAVHVDHHAFEIHPLDQDLHFLGTDGGLYVSKNGGNTWTHIDNLPVTEFYTCEIDAIAPHRYYGGAQDNGTLRTLTGSVDDWERIFGGDGFVVVVDPVDNNIMYCEYQYGFLYKSTDGGFEWEYSLEGVDGNDRTNWNTPFVMSPHHNQRLYYGSHRLYTTTDGAFSWTPISGDLTNTDPQSPGGENFGALSTIGLTPADSNVIYTGSEDGHVYVTFNHGGHWERISDDLPVRYVTRVAVDPYDPMVAYVTISGYKEFDFLPHIFMTTDGGQNWTDISGNLPEVPLNDVVIDPDQPATLYVASDLGVWYTTDLGVAWDLLGEGLPITAYTDLELHTETRKLLAASFGLSMFTYDLGEPVSPTRENDIAILEIRVTPNPVSDVASVRFSVEKAQTLRITLSDLRGRTLLTLADAVFPAGAHSVTGDFSQIPPGVYIIRVTGERGGASTKVVVE